MSIPKSTTFLAIFSLVAIILVVCAGRQSGADCMHDGSTPNSTVQIKPATGPLRLHPANPRYFTDGTGHAIYLTGSHTWGNLSDFLTGWPSFDYTRYLDFLDAYNHNFIRLWSGYTTGVSPTPYVRTGPGTALDGQPKVDLTRFNQAYFDQLRSRVVAARDRGIYVGIMLFRPDGVKRDDVGINIFNPANNIQGINGDTNRDQFSAETYNLTVPKITAYQEAFVRKLIDTVNDLDNVLYEIGNEGDLTSIAWQNHFIDFIKSYEASKPMQHPVGMTAVFNIQDGSWRPDDTALFNSRADWISPGAAAYKDNPPAADGSKIVIADVDHIWPRQPHRGWIWESFLRGLQPILMDWYSYGSPTWTSSAEQEAMRKYMGYTLTYAQKINLTAMTPQNNLCSTTYCLANPGMEYLMYLPFEPHWIESWLGSTRFVWRFMPLVRKFRELFRLTVTVDLSATVGTFAGEWFDPNTGKVIRAGTLTGGVRRAFRAPFRGDAVLYLTVGATTSQQ